MKLLQNRVAESGHALPFMVVWASLAWALAGWRQTGHWAVEWWPSLACFALTVVLIVETSNGNALLRVRSRMVSCTFIALSCAACFQFGSLAGASVQLCFAAATLLLLQTYQAPTATGKTMYAFACVGAASCVFVQSLLFVPLLWLMMAVHLQSLCWRTWTASVLGLLLPWWLLMPWALWHGNTALVASHLAGLFSLGPGPWACGTVGVGPVAVLMLTVVLTATGMIHFWRYGYEDKIRIRQLYGFFSTMTVAAIVMLVLQPCHHDPLLRLCTAWGSPLIAHFFTLTSSRPTNVMFIVSSVLVALTTLLNLWMPSLAF